jgi:hypothetical protein
VTLTQAGERQVIGRVIGARRLGQAGEQRRLPTVLGSTPWVLALALLGKGVGQNWESWRHHLSYLDYVIAAAIVIGAVWWLL